MTRLRQLTKKLTEPFGLDGAFRRVYVEGSLLGEYLKFGLVGRPDPSTSVVLAGSGRSGTTWLQEVLSALPGVQPIFEPLHPRFVKDVRRLNAYDERDPYFRARYLRPEEENAEWTSFLENVLIGRVRNYWTDYERVSYFPDKFLIKMIRANLLLGYLARRFSPCIIYVLRHPCAVIESRLAVGWHADVMDILMQDDLMTDWLEPWADQIASESDELGAHAVWWAAENMVALSHLKGTDHLVVYYEEMVLDPETVLTGLTDWLGWTDIWPKVKISARVASRTSRESITYQDKQDRLSHWQQSLSIEDQRRVLGWAQHLSLDMYDEHFLPVHLRGGISPSQ